MRTWFSAFSQMVLKWWASTISTTTTIPASKTHDCANSAWARDSGFSPWIWPTARRRKASPQGNFDAVIHLAAQAGVRRSLTSPEEYVASNLVAFVNILEGVRACACRHFVFASSSSVYGANKKIPFAEDDSTDYPVSLYAATKKSNEVLAHAYSHLFVFPPAG